MYFLDETCEQAENKRSRMDQVGGGSSNEMEQSSHSEQDYDHSEQDSDHSEQEPNRYEEELQDLLNQHRNVINAEDRLHPRQDVYNIRVSETFTFDNLINRLRRIYQQQRNAFRINISFSCVLRNIETGELRFFYASSNTSVLDAPMLVSDAKTFRHFIDVLEAIDILEWTRRQRPNSKWVFFSLVQALVTVTRLNFPIGHPSQLPPYVINNESIIALAFDRHTGEPYNDNLCLFRCLALHQGAGERHLHRATNSLFVRYLQETSQDRENFDVVDLRELDIVEGLFEVAINVYSIDEDSQAISIRRSVAEFPPMYVNLHENHFSFIKDINSFCHSFVCRKCSKIFSIPYRLTRHEQTCDVNVKHKFPGRTYQVPKNIFEELEEFGFEFEPRDKFFHTLPHGT